MNARKDHAPQSEMQNVLRCAEALQHWPLDRIEKAMDSAEAELLEKLPSLKGPLEMIRRAEPHGMDVIAVMWVSDHSVEEGQFEHVPFTSARRKRLKEFILLAKLRALLIQRACPHTRRTRPSPATPAPATQREMKMPGLTVSRA